MQFLIPLIVILSGCVPADDSKTEERDPQLQPVLAGRLENRNIIEASGMVRAQQHDGVFWIVDDGGKPRLHAIDARGRTLGRIKVDDAKVVDWEDIASFSLDGRPYLAIADIGDNNARRKDVRVYVVREPQVGDDEVDIEWEFDFTYPAGPVDAESLAVDAGNEQILVLSKREIPAVLYALPLRPGNDKRQTAERLGAVTTLPRPQRTDVELASKIKSWWWQPTAMDINADSSAAVVLTYRGVFLYPRDDGESWIDAMRRRPVVLDIGDYGDAESVAFSGDASSVYITFEGSGAPLVRVPVAAQTRPDSGGVTIMTFNAQNLFDNLDDPGKDDKAFLPVAAKQGAAHIDACNEIEVRSWREECLHLDWDDDTVTHKLGVLAATIRQVNDGRGADIIAFQEVENVGILERLRTEHLAGLGYRPSILVEGSDRRGIDLAFLSKLPLDGEARLRNVSFDEFGDRARDTRSVLEATFVLPDGQLLTGFAVHFPAPHQPPEMRIVAYEHLNRLLDELPNDRLVFAAGDFNTKSSEMYDDGMLARFVEPHWQPAHEQCKACRGTYYYRPDDNWSFLDMILFAHGRGKKTTWRIRADSVRLANGLAAQTTAAGTPNRYRAEFRSGVSDHWPLIVTIEPARNQ